jgi:XTP/dITP diphosphohydrolase
VTSQAVFSLVVASNNSGKLREIGALLEPFGWEVHPQSEWEFEEAVEDASTFVENALIKARHAARRTGLPSLGDDSGLLVDALDGRPGLRSARYADGAGSAANIEKLLGELEGLPEEQRTAYFYCVMVMLRSADDATPLITTGQWPGRITSAARGEGGFGYDPVFYVPEREATAAELPAPIKNVISHRGQALATMIRLLKQEFPA